MLVIKFDTITLLSTIITDATGSFSASVKIPGDAAEGGRMISVIDETGRTVPSLFTVTTPGIISISPSKGPAGTQVMLSGSNFLSNARLSVKVDGLGVRTFPVEAVSSAIGTFMAKLRIPSNITEGVHTISIEDGTGKIGTALFTITSEPFSLSVSPVSGNGATVTVRGVGFPPRAPVSISFDGEIVDTSPAKLKADPGGSFTASFNLPGNAPNGNYTITALTSNGNATAILSLKRQYIDDRYGILININPQKYDFAAGETVAISGKVLALRNDFPLLLKVINPNNAACSFQQLTLDKEMNFVAESVKLGGKLCNTEGEYKITAFYGKGKAITKFRLAGPSAELSGGEAEVLNAQRTTEILRYDNKYPVDLDWAANSVRMRNNVNATVTFYLMFVEYDADEITKRLTYEAVTLEPYEATYKIAPFVPQIVDGKPNGYLHVFVWESLDDPKPLHPGLYVPY
jgi:hypothetical protein